MGIFCHSVVELASQVEIIICRRRLFAAGAADSCESRVRKEGSRQKFPPAAADSRGKRRRNREIREGRKPAAREYEVGQI